MSVVASSKWSARRWLQLTLLAVALLGVRCSNDEPTHIGAASYLTKVTLGAGQVATATAHAGRMPAPHGSLSLTIPASNMAINGGTTNVTVQSAASIDTVYVAIDGTDGYYEIHVPTASSLVPLLLTLAQQLPEMEFDVTFEARDTQGNISQPQSLPTTIKEVGTGDVQVSISWDVDNDLDLHVIDPNGFDIGFDDEQSPEGGELDLDSNASCDIDHVRNENIRWPTGKAPHGTYTVYVDNYENCTSTKANFTVTVQVAKNAPQLFSGSFDANDAGDEDETSGSSSAVQAGKLITTFTFP